MFPQGSRVHVALLQNSAGRTLRGEYRRRRRSHRWKFLNQKFKEKVSQTKAKFYEKKVGELKEGKPGQWYSILKRLCSHDQMKTDKTECEDIREKTDQQQAELIADRFSSVSNEYNPIEASSKRRIRSCIYPSAGLESAIETESEEGNSP